MGVDAWELGLDVDCEMITASSQSRLTLVGGTSVQIKTPSAVRCECPALDRLKQSVG